MRKPRFVAVITANHPNKFSVYDRQLMQHVCEAAELSLARQLAGQYCEAFDLSWPRRLWNLLTGQTPKLPPPPPPLETEWEIRIRRIQEICDQRKRNRRFGAPIVRTYAEEEKENYAN